MEQDQADRIEAKLDWLIAKVGEAEAAVELVIGSVSTNPMLKSFLPKL